MKAKILVIEDSRSQSDHIEALLTKGGYDVLTARTGVEGLALARSERPEVIVLDVVMNDMDGFAVCRFLKVHEETRDIPVVMLTVRSDVADRVEGLNVGADDYLPKPFADEELEARVFAALRSRMKAEQLRQRTVELEGMLRQVEALAVTDPLTGLFNRRRFDDLLLRELRLTQRYGNPLSCILVDVDRFKAINDELGHDAGDNVLKQLAAILPSTLREVDHVTRIGGEEFAILTPHTPKQAARVAAERIRGIIASAEFRVGAQVRAVTASFGIADSSDADVSQPGTLVAAADFALLRAKREGRNRVVLYDPDTDKPAADGDSG